MLMRFPIATCSIVLEHYRCYIRNNRFDDLHIRASVRCQDRRNISVAFTIMRISWHKQISHHIINAFCRVFDDSGPQSVKDHQPLYTGIKRPCTTIFDIPIASDSGWACAIKNHILIIDEDITNGRKLRPKRYSICHRKSGDIR